MLKFREFAVVRTDKFSEWNDRGRNPVYCNIRPNRTREGLFAGVKIFSHIRCLFVDLASANTGMKDPREECKLFCGT